MAEPRNEDLEEVLSKLETINLNDKQDIFWPSYIVIPKYDWTPPKPKHPYGNRRGRPPLDRSKIRVLPLTNTNNKTRLGGHDVPSETKL